MSDDPQQVWLPVIGKALAFLCLGQVEQKDPERVDGIVKKVKFLEGLGLSRADAAETIGSTSESVRVMIAQSGRKSRAKNQK